jgi:hypothetical protein
MKARLLKKILNDTGYAISNNDTYIAVGSPMCHNLISVDKATLRVKYALDTFSKGREALTKSSPELLFIWDKLHELITSGEIQDIVNGKDEIENPLPVFTVNSDGKLIESITDAYGWPNTDDGGICMYNNTHFPTKEQAIKAGLDELRARKTSIVENISQRRKDLCAAIDRLKECNQCIEDLLSEQ